MPLPPSAALNVSHPTPVSFDDVAINTQQTIRWSERQPFFPEALWHGGQLAPSTCAAIPNSVALPMISVAGPWIDLDNYPTPFPHIPNPSTAGRTNRLFFPHYKFEEYTALRIEFNLSGYVSGAGGHVYIMCKIQSLDRYEPTRNMDIPPAPVFPTVNNTILADLYYNTLGEHHTLRPNPIITPVIGLGWWCIEPVIYTPAGCTWTTDSEDFFSMSIVECLPQSPRWEGQIT